MPTVCEMPRRKDLETFKNAKITALADGYAQRHLDLKLHPKQAAVLRDLFPAGKKQSRVSFRCGNEVGKTSHVAVAAILYALDILNAQVISTAGVWMQVVEQLIPSLKRFSNLYPQWRFLDSAISINGIDRYVGFSTRDEGFAQGFHKREGMPLLAIIDEAASVAPGIFNGVEDRCNPDFFLVMGSPLDPSGSFYDIETKLSKFYTHHHLGQPECLTTDGYWIDPISIERKLAKWGEKHPFIQSNIYGEFSQRVENALISLGELESCLANPPEWMRRDQRHAFIDFAAGRAKNVFAMRCGNKVWIEKKWTERDTMATVGECLATFKKLEREYGLQPDEVEGDADGMGIGLIHRLREVGLSIGEFHGGSPAIYSDDYANQISESWHESIGQIIRRDIILPHDDDFKAQILSRMSKRNSRGKFMLESKEDMAKRGLDSPDEADGILRAMMPLVSNKSFNLLGQQQEQDTRGWVERARAAGHGGGNFGGLATMEGKR